MRGKMEKINPTELIPQAKNVSATAYKVFAIGILDTLLTVGWTPEQVLELIKYVGANINYQFRNEYEKDLKGFEAELTQAVIQHDASLKVGKFWVTESCNN